MLNFLYNIRVTLYLHDVEIFSFFDKDTNDVKR